MHKIIATCARDNTWDLEYVDIYRRKGLGSCLSINDACTTAFKHMVPGDTALSITRNGKQIVSSYEDMKRAASQITEDKDIPF